MHRDRSLSRVALAVSVTQCVAALVILRVVAFEPVCGAHAPFAVNFSCGRWEGDKCEFTLYAPPRARATRALWMVLFAIGALANAPVFKNVYFDCDNEAKAAVLTVTRCVAAAILAESLVVVPLPFPIYA